LLTFGHDRSGVKDQFNGQFRFLFASAFFPAALMMLRVSVFIFNLFLPFFK
jgi:hypothetical protein